MNVSGSNGRGTIGGFTAGLAAGTAVLVVAAFFAGAFGVNFDVRSLGGFAPTESAETEQAAKTPSAPPALTQVLLKHLDALQPENRSSFDQGVLVETMEGEVLVEHNSDRAYNPASVLKLATTLAALDKFGADHRFKTEILADGEISDKALHGNLAVRSDGDPTLGKEAVAKVVDALHGAGINKVDGDLVVSGPFSYVTTDETPAAAQRFKTALGSAGIKIAGSAHVAGSVSGTSIMTTESEPLSEIIRRQNAHSVNRIADNLGTAVGGPAGLTRYLVESGGLDASTLRISHTSGLDDNRITPAAAMKVLRALLKSAQNQGLAVDEVLPLNGVDSGTMRRRMTGDGLLGSIAAKTGTQQVQDGGVAALCGVAYTRARGPVLFVVFNNNGNVHFYRDWEDSLLADVIQSCGGPAPLNRSTDLVPQTVDDHSAVVAYRPRKEPIDPFVKASEEKVVEAKPATDRPASAKATDTKRSDKKAAPAKGDTAKPAAAKRPEPKRAAASRSRSAH